MRTTKKDKHKTHYMITDSHDNLDSLETRLNLEVPQHHPPQHHCIDNDLLTILINFNANKLQFHINAHKKINESQERMIINQPNKLPHHKLLSRCKSQ